MTLYIINSDHSPELQLCSKWQTFPFFYEFVSYACPQIYASAFYLSSSFLSKLATYL